MAKPASHDSDASDHQSWARLIVERLWARLVERLWARIVERFWARLRRHHAALILVDDDPRRPHGHLEFITSIEGG